MKRTNLTSKKLSLFTVAAIGTSMLAASAAMAKPARPHRHVLSKQRLIAAETIKANQTFSSLDTNRDGLIMKRDVDARRWHSLAVADFNKDLATTRKEFVAYKIYKFKVKQLGMQAVNPASTMKNAPIHPVVLADNLRRWSANATANFHKLDRNHDGVLTKSELGRRRIIRYKMQASWKLTFRGWKRVTKRAPVYTYRLSPAQQRIFSARDYNKDEVVTLAEYRGYAMYSYQAVRLGLSVANPKYRLAVLPMHPKSPKRHAYASATTWEWGVDFSNLFIFG